MPDKQTLLWTTFQHTAARRRLGRFCLILCRLPSFNTQPPEGGWAPIDSAVVAAQCFNTQPPEGGWPRVGSAQVSVRASFNTQPPEGGWLRRLGYC